MSPRRRSAVSQGGPGEPARGACCELQGASSSSVTVSKGPKCASPAAHASASKLPTRRYMDRTESCEQMSTWTSPDCRPATTMSCRADNSSTTAAPIVPAPPITMMRTRLPSEGCAGCVRHIAAQVISVRESPSSSDTPLVPGDGSGPVRCRGPRPRPSRVRYSRTAQAPRLSGRGDRPGGAFTPRRASPARRAHSDRHRGQSRGRSAAAAHSRQ
jgi:hypothetical protein